MAVFIFELCLAEDCRFRIEHPPRTCYTSLRGMLGKTQNLRSGRGLLAACLVFLFSFSSLAPLAASAFPDSSSDMPCCKTKGRCCCRKRPRANPTSGPVVNASSCVDCRGGTLGSVNAMGYAVIRLQVLTPVIRAAGGVDVNTILTRARISDHSLRQRPPPQDLLA